MLWLPTGHPLLSDKEDHDKDLSGRHVKACGRRRWLETSNMMPFKKGQIMPDKAGGFLQWSGCIGG